MIVTSNDFLEYIEDLIKDRIISKESLSGGSIALVQKLTFASGKCLVLKTGGKNLSFQKEANGLIELSKSNTIRIPKIIASDSNFILLEFISQAKRSACFYSSFGKQLAQMHRYTGENYGFFEDNFIGDTVQFNKVSKQHEKDWPLFYWEQRLLPQFNLAIKNGFNEEIFYKLMSKIESVVEEVLSTSNEKPTLLHGDLWGGNYLIDLHNQPVLIDPAVYYGNRETDIAMTKLFGGFSEQFYQSYQNEFPLAEGWQKREPLYQLYHVLNHLNLFGSRYYQRVLELMRRY